MNVHLMFRDRDLDLQGPLPWNADALVTDLALDTIFDAMAGSDAYVRDIVRKAVLAGAGAEVDAVLYRQAVLKDCLAHPDVVKAVYAIAVDTIEERRKHWWGFSMRYASYILHSSVELLRMFTTMLRKLRAIADAHGHAFESEGFTAFFAMLQRDVDDEYLARIDRHLEQLKFRDGVLMSAQLGPRGEGVNYGLRQLAPTRQGWLERMLGVGEQGHTFRIHERDEAGARALSDLQARAINAVANAAAQATDHVLSFFTTLRSELAFYIACLNLHERLVTAGVPVAYPVPLASDARRFACDELCDMALALTIGARIVGNTVNADGRDLVVITGANQGGKSTFLRSVGSAQLLMQAGCFVAARGLSASTTPMLCTHYKREEDAAMESGKFDEELVRMSELADHLVPHALVLFNESFAATNEREGSEIADQIVRALREHGVRVFYVTHLYAFAHRAFERHAPDATFLRAGREADGMRPFRLVEGEPLDTSYGEDLYRKIFAERSAASPFTPR